MSTIQPNNETYTITPYGLLGQVINDEDASAAVDALTLYMLRQAKPGHVIGIVADGGNLAFVQVFKGES